jgi:CO dehydrogenase maturation factor
MGAAYAGDELCIDCGLCSAKNAIEASDAREKIRQYLISTMSNKKLNKKIAVCGKGGTGKSTFVSLMAYALHDAGYSVLVLDTDESNPGLYRMLGFAGQEPPVPLMKSYPFNELNHNNEWLDRQELSINDIPDESILRNNNLGIVLMGKIEEPFQGCACSMADIARNFVQKLVLKDKEILLIDMEAGIESFGRGFERGVDTILIIVEPSFESISLANKISYMAAVIGVNRVKAVLNKVPSQDVEQILRQELYKKKIDVLGTLHFELNISESSLRGIPISPGANSRTLVKNMVEPLFRE